MNEQGIKEWAADQLENDPLYQQWLALYQQWLAEQEAYAFEDNY